MSKEEIIKEITNYRDGYVKGSATYVAYNNCLELINKLN